MNSIWINIGAYTIITTIMVWLFIIFIENKKFIIFKKSETFFRMCVFFIFLSFSWSAFMVIYQVTDYESIVGFPENEMTRFEKVSNIIYAIIILFIVYLLRFYIKIQKKK